MSTAFPLGRSILAAAAIIGIAAALSALAPAHISADLAQRLTGALLGAVVVVYANAIPKLLVARARLRCTPAQDQAARRFAGWSLVLGGAGYMLASLLAPLGIAAPLGGALLASALLIAVLRCLRRA
jgi:di/tricarboxylate transporter